MRHISNPFRKSRTLSSQIYELLCAKFNKPIPMESLRKAGGLYGEMLTGEQLWGVLDRVRRYGGSVVRQGKHVRLIKYCSKTCLDPKDKKPSQSERKKKRYKKPSSKSHLSNPYKDKATITSRVYEFLCANFNKFLPIDLIQETCRLPDDKLITRDQVWGAFDRIRRFGGFLTTDYQFVIKFAKLTKFCHRTSYGAKERIKRVPIDTIDGYEKSLVEDTGGHKKRLVDKPQATQLRRNPFKVDSKVYKIYGFLCANFGKVLSVEIILEQAGIPHCSRQLLWMVFYRIKVFGGIINRYIEGIPFSRGGNKPVNEVKLIKYCDREIAQSSDKIPKIISLGIPYDQRSEDIKENLKILGLTFLPTSYLLLLTKYRQRVQEAVNAKEHERMNLAFGSLQKMFTHSEERVYTRSSLGSFFLS